MTTSSGERSGGPRDERGGFEVYIVKLVMVFLFILSQSLTGSLDYSVKIVV